MMGEHGTTIGQLIKMWYVVNCKALQKRFTIQTEMEKYVTLAKQLKEKSDFVLKPEKKKKKKKK